MTTTGKSDVLDVAGAAWYRTRADRGCRCAECAQPVKAGTMGLRERMLLSLAEPRWLHVRCWTDWLSQQDRLERARRQEERARERQATGG